ncbi:hypothetical protein V8F33_002713 [Rhypophila sp. PSN 637]
MFIPHQINVEKGSVGLGPSTSLMDYDAFREFLAGMHSSNSSLVFTHIVPRKACFQIARLPTMVC